MLDRELLGLAKADSPFSSAKEGRRAMSGGKLLNGTGCTLPSASTRSSMTFFFSKKRRYSAVGCTGRDDVVLPRVAVQLYGDGARLRPSREDVRGRVTEPASKRRSRNACGKAAVIGLRWVPSSYGW